MTYNPKKYWEARGHKYHPDSGHREVKLFLKSIKAIKNYRHLSMLEVGSGNGRIYNEIRNTMGMLFDYSMVDFADSLIEECHFNTGMKPDKWDGVTLPYNDGDYDLVLSINVFLHVPPEDIGRVFAEHVRVSAKYLFICTYFKGVKNLARHCFEHDYYSLFKKHNLSIIRDTNLRKTNKVWLLGKLD